MSVLAVLAAVGAQVGGVQATSSRWTAAGDMIITDVVVRTDDGETITITQPGGTVDGIGMSVSHSPPPLHAGDRVSLVAQRGGYRVDRVPDRTARVRPATGASRTGVQRTSRSLRPLYHASGCLAFTLVGGTDAISGDGEWDAFHEAFTAWEDASSTEACGKVTLGSVTAATATEGRDGTNTIRFRDDTWCRPATPTEAEVCHSPDAVAITRVLFVDNPSDPRDGEIIEVDIEVNAVDFTLSLDASAGTIDLASAAAHEIGHALGLDHNCGVSNGVWPAGLDGELVESCEEAPAELVAATMYFQVPPGTTTMRTPEPEDTGGLCSVVGEACRDEITGGCSAGAGAGPLLGLALLALRRRKR